MKRLLFILFYVASLQAVFTTALRGKRNALTSFSCNVPDDRKSVKHCHEYAKQRKEILDTTGETIADFPHLITLGWQVGDTNSYKFMCGGVLISKDYIITAAHCSNNPQYDKPSIVRFGPGTSTLSSDTPLDPSTDIKIAKIIRHPQYQTPKKYYDIALMQLERDVTFDKNVLPACIWTEADTSTLQNVLNPLWEIESGPITLNKNKMDLIDSATCNETMKSAITRKWLGVEDHQICAKQTVEPKKCKREVGSGNPLQANVEVPEVGPVPHVIGVSSFGIRCSGQKPDVFTRLSSFVDWIESTVWSE